jgi:hypothetical protein
MCSLRSKDSLLMRPEGDMVGNFYRASSLRTERVAKNTHGKDQV